MTTHPNQRVIIMDRDKNRTYGNFTQVSKDAIQSACRYLDKTGALKLWLYLVQNTQSGFGLALSSKDFMQFSKCAKTTYQRAFDDLVQYGFLVPKENTTNTYYFRDKPIEEQQIVYIEREPQN